MGVAIKMSGSMGVEREAGSTSLADVFDRLLDKGIYLDAWIRTCGAANQPPISFGSYERRIVVQPEEWPADTDLGTALEVLASRNPSAAAILSIWFRRVFIAARSHQHNGAWISEQVATDSENRENRFGVFLVYTTSKGPTIANISGAFARVLYATGESTVIPLDPSMPPPETWEGYPYRSVVDAQRAAAQHLLLVTGHACTNDCRSWSSSVV